jgi:hypothetical protein
MTYGNVATHVNPEFAVNVIAPVLETLTIPFPGIVIVCAVPGVRRTPLIDCMVVPVESPVRGVRVTGVVLVVV